LDKADLICLTFEKAKPVVKQGRKVMGLDGRRTAGVMP